jgi:hypothetical protein
VVTPEVVTPEVVTTKVAVVEPEATVTNAGTVRLGLLLVSDTGIPAAGAGAFKVMVQMEVPFPCREDGLQESDTNW